jgi:hypothetical protein
MDCGPSPEGSILQEIPMIYFPAETQTLSGAAISTFAISVVILTRWRPGFFAGVARKTRKYCARFGVEGTGDTRERIIIIVSMVVGEVESFIPSVFSQHVETVKFGKLALSLLGLLVSLTMLVQSIRSPNVGPGNAEASIAWQPKQNLSILFVVALTVLVLGALLYFLPFRH